MPYRDPDQRRAYDREYQRTRRAGGGPTPGQTVVPIPFRLKTAADVLTLLEELANRCPIPGVMLERDGRFPSQTELDAELDAIAGAARRGVCHVG